MSAEATARTDDTFDDTPEGAAKRWYEEFKAAQDALDGWHKAAEECDKQYRDDEERDDQRLNLYAAGVDLKEATLYGNPPTVDVKRRNDDQGDDVARVAGELLDRLLNGDLQRDEEAFPRALGQALKDWLIPGFGNLWFRLERETRVVPGKPAVIDDEGMELAPEVPETTEVVREEAPTDYVFWKDHLWSPCRVFGEMRWMARRALLSKRTFEAKFGDEKVPFAIGADPKDATIPRTPWARVEVWEIWDKECGCVWWFVEGHSRVLVPKGLQANTDGSLPDPLQIAGFWPFPEPLVDGVTTSKFVPRPHYARSQDLYRTIDDETTRIGILRDAVDASCVYDKTVGELGQILDSKAENRAIPAQNYKALAEKGGIAACVSWKPLDQIVNAMNVLRDLRREDIQLLFQVDGTSDIMRGQATNSGATATEIAVEAKYGSIRGGRAQKRFARFCSEGQRIRAEIICRHFSPETIMLRANAKGLPPEDQALVNDAIALLKSDVSCYRIEVKDEAVSLTDYAANRQESMEVLGTLGNVVKLSQGLPPQMIPAFLRLVQIALARVKGGDNYEAAIDALVKQAEAMVQQQAAQPPQPNPALQVAQIKAQAEAGKAKAQMAQTQMDMQQAAAEHAMGMQKLEAEVRADAMKQALAGPAGPLQPGMPA